MELTNKYKRVPVGDIVVDRANRQRREIDVTDLLDSIQKRGVMNPIIVTRELVLVAGERRLQASRELGLSDIPCRFIEDLSTIEAQIVELEENLKRKDLPWRDQTVAIGKLHELYCEQEENWSQQQTAAALGLSSPSVAITLRVASEIDNPKIAQATGMMAAYNVLARADSRKVADAMSDIIEGAVDIFAKVGEKTPEPDPNGEPSAPPPPPLPDPESILHQSFLEWAPKYKGKPFNFIHCDFPYGVNVFGGTQAGGQTWDPYADDPEVYWTLIRCLCENLDRVMANSGHIMFWLAGDINIQHKTLETFAKLAPTLDFQTYPLIWQKSDNMGILPDPKRGPRRVYETALIGAREDRLIVKPVANAYHAPTDKTHHPSTKPEPVLRHFFQMFVDENTRMLDPTCGGGSSLRAAESLGASQVLGLEINEEYYNNAKTALRQFRVLRKATKG